MTALDVIRDIAEYSRPDALSRIRADAMLRARQGDHP